MIYELIPPTDPRVLSSIAPFDEKKLKEDEKITPKEFADNMFETMKKYGGIGLSANQCGKPYRMFVMGDHPNIKEGKKWVCYNPEIKGHSRETIRFKEGCLTFPYLFLDVERPRAVAVEYYDENMKKVEENLTGMPARIFQHEFDHMQGIVFTEHVSKFKLQFAMKKRDNIVKKVQRQWQQIASQK
jgi:peptide deformylase